MTIDRKLLEIMVCPVTKQTLSVLSQAKLDLLNEKISKGEVSNHAGETLSDPLQSALISKNNTTIYPVIDNFPVMLEEQSVNTLQLKDWT